MSEFCQQFINGLSLGAIYALIAVGYTMVYGVLRLINFAHGDILMVGAMAGLYLLPGSLGHVFPPGWAWVLVMAIEAALVVGLIVSVRECMKKGPDRVRYAWIAALNVALIVTFAVLKVKGLLAADQPWPKFAWAAASGVLVCVALRVRYRWIAALMAGLVIVFVVILRQDVGAAGKPSWWMFVWAMASAMLVCGALGYLIEFIAYRPMRNQPRINALITAIGVSLFLEYGGQLKQVFTPSPQAFPQLIPGLEHHPDLLTVFGVIIPKVDTLIICLTLVMMVVLRHIVMRTRTGMALRAVSFRFDTAALMGIDVNRIVSFTFVLGSMLAAAAGLLLAIRAPKVEPLMGLLIGLKAFVAAVLGGIGNVPGAVAGGCLLGLTEVMVSGYVPQGSQYRDGVAFVILIAVLLVKPSGLFGANVVEKV